jgi:hypothetical protein
MGENSEIRIQNSEFRRWITIMAKVLPANVEMGGSVLQGLRFINEHNRNIVLNGIDHLTGRANEAITLVIKRDRPFALRAGQNIEKFFFYHG